MCYALVSFPTTLETAPRGASSKSHEFKHPRPRCPKFEFAPTVPFPRRLWKPHPLGLSLPTQRGARVGARDPPLSPGSGGAGVSRQGPGSD